MEKLASELISIEFQYRRDDILREREIQEMRQGNIWRNSDTDREGETYIQGGEIREPGKKDRKEDRKE
jgi:hypothetical protein